METLTALFELFITFFQIGLFTFGGGYAMIPMIQDAVLRKGWMTEQELIDFIAISESTPGPFAINIATYVGAETVGILGSVCATLGVVLPSFIIILIIAALIRNFLKYKGVQAFLGGIRPCVVGLILATALTMLMSTLLSFRNIGNSVMPDLRGLIIFAIIAATAVTFKAARKKPLSPIVLILVSAGLGMAVYSF